MGLLWLLLLFLGAGGAQGCGPGRFGARRRTPRKLTPLVFKQHVPNVPETSMGASGPSEERIRWGDARFLELVPNYNKDIVFKDRSSNGADRLSTQGLKERLDTLAISVMNQWPGVRLRVAEGFDGEGWRHSPRSLHYSGRAVDLTTADRDHSKYGMLARLAVEAGFDWVYYESRAHIHCSVKKEPSSSSKSSGCFHGNSSVLTKQGPKLMSELKVGEEVASGFLLSDGSLTFSKVVAFLHRDPYLTTGYVRITTESGCRIALTPDHLLFRLQDLMPTAVYASALRVGDMVYCRSPSDGVTLTAVTEVETVTMTGVFAPVTADGTVFVDGVWASCYAVVDSHQMAHVALFPVRLAYVISERLKSALLWSDGDFRGVDSWRVCSNGSFVNSSKRQEDCGCVHWYARVLFWIYSMFFI